MSIVHLIIGHLDVFFGEMSNQFFAHFKNWVALLLLSYQSSLYILDTRLLVHIWLANTFIFSVGCLFTFLIVSFEAHPFLILMMSNLSIFLVTYALCVISRKPLPNQRSWRLTPMFSSKNFIILAFAFRSLKHFSLIF